MNYSEQLKSHDDILDRYLHAFEIVSKKLQPYLTVFTWRDGDRHVNQSSILIG